MNVEKYQRKNAQMILKEKTLDSLAIDNTCSLLEESIMLNQKTTKLIRSYNKEN